MTSHFVPHAQVLQIGVYCRNGAKLLRAFSQIVEGNEKGNRKRAAFWGCPFFIGQLLKAADCFLLQGGFVRA